ncbi:MAG: hypothetical protein IPJ50_13380 [Betaproteobacteria bacterium]|nr:hypothetical protein [Betaproteobacteria bacterium]
MSSAFAQQRQRGLIIAQINHIAAEHGVIAPSIRIGQQLAGRHVERRQRRNAANLIFPGGCHQSRCGLQDDFKLDWQIVNQ